MATPAPASPLSGWWTKHNLRNFMIPLIAITLLLILWAVVHVVTYPRNPTIPHPHDEKIERAYLDSEEWYPL